MSRATPTVEQHVPAPAGSVRWPLLPSTTQPVAELPEFGRCSPISRSRAASAVKAPFVRRRSSTSRASAASAAACRCGLTRTRSIRSSKPQASIHRRAVSILGPARPVSYRTTAEGDVRARLASSARSRASRISVSRVRGICNGSHRSTSFRCLFASPVSEPGSRVCRRLPSRYMNPRRNGACRQRRLAVNGTSASDWLANPRQGLRAFTGLSSFPMSVRSQDFDTALRPDSFPVAGAVRGDRGSSVPSYPLHIHDRSSSQGPDIKLGGARAARRRRPPRPPAFECESLLTPLQPENQT